MTNPYENPMTLPELIAPDGLQRVPPQPFAVLGGIDLIDYPWMDSKPFVKGNIYIAGPMRGMPQFNFPAFYEAEERLQRLGWNCGNPARMDDESDIPPAETGVKDAMRRDLTWLTDYATAVYMLKGWEKSEGATTEHKLAVTLGLPIYYEASL